MFVHFLVCFFVLRLFWKCIHHCVSSCGEEDGSGERGLLHTWMGYSYSTTPERILLSRPVLQAALGARHGVLLVEGNTFIIHTGYTCKFGWPTLCKIQIFDEQHYVNRLKSTSKWTIYVVLLCASYGLQRTNVFLCDLLSKCNSMVCLWHVPLVWQALE